MRFRLSRTIMTLSPVLETSHHLLAQDDLVCDGLVPLDLQQHVMVVLIKQQVC